MSAAMENTTTVILPTSPDESVAFLPSTVANTTTTSSSAASMLLPCAPSLATATTSTATAATATAAAAPAMLREWNSPPVAPAVVLMNEHYEDSSPTPSSSSSRIMRFHSNSHHTPPSHGTSLNVAYSYPVATFVTNLVRNTVDHIYANVIDENHHQQQSAVISDHPGHHHHHPTAAAAAALPIVQQHLPHTTPPPRHSHHHHMFHRLYSSSSSSPAALNPAAITTLVSSSTATGGPPPTTTISTTAQTTLHTGGDDCHHPLRASPDNSHDVDAAEFVFLDGDLVAIPAPPPNEEERDELEFQLRLESKTSCQPKRIRRGVRGFRKWIRNRGRNQNNQSQPVPESLPHSSCESAIAATAKPPPTVISTLTPAHHHQHHHHVTQPAPLLQPAQPQQQPMMIPPPPPPLLPPPPPPPRLHRHATDLIVTSRPPTTIMTPSPYFAVVTASPPITSLNAPPPPPLHASATAATTAAGFVTTQHPTIMMSHRNNTMTTATPPQSLLLSEHVVGIKGMPQQNLQQQHSKSVSPSRRWTKRANRKMPLRWTRNHSKNDMSVPSRWDPNHVVDGGDGGGKLKASSRRRTLSSHSIPPSSVSATSAASQAEFEDNRRYASTATTTTTTTTTTTILPSSPPRPNRLPTIHRSSTVSAEYMGNADQLLEAGVLLVPQATASAEIAYIDDYYIDINDGEFHGSGTVKKDDIPVASVLPPDADYKVDKADAPCIDSMLRQAEHETDSDDVEQSTIETASIVQPSQPVLPPLLRHINNNNNNKRGKSDGTACPLSTCSLTDQWVYNDILKVIMVGAANVDKSSLAWAIRQTTKKPQKKRTTLGVDVHVWTPNSNMMTMTTMQHHHNQNNHHHHHHHHHDDDENDNLPLPPQQSPPSQIKFSIWDVQGVSNTPTTSSLSSCRTTDDECTANAGAHPGTQSLFFSPKALYILVWDLACSNVKTFRRHKVRGRHNQHHHGGEHENDDEDDDRDDEEEDENEFCIEEANRRADGALQSDIRDRVLSWVDCIARRGPSSAILPVVLIPKDDDDDIDIDDRHHHRMDPSEVLRRCAVMQSMLDQHIRQFEFRESSSVPPKLLLGGQNSILRVNLFADHNVNGDTGASSGGDYQTTGIVKLQEMIVAIAIDVTHSVFDHVGTPVPSGTVQVLDIVRRFKADRHKLVLLDHLLAELGPSFSVDEAMEALTFLCSVGEILYFGRSNDPILSRYIVLKGKWLVSALSCILRNDLKRELAETRRFMRMQCLYSNQEFPENEVSKTLMCGDNSSCPVLSSADSSMLWQSMSFMREAADRSAQLSQNSCSATTTSTMFDFLEHLLVQFGMFMPLTVSRSAFNQDKSDKVYFVPSLLAQANPEDYVWTFKSSESWLTTLCDSWLFRDGAPLDLMENVSVSILRNLYDFSKVFSYEIEADHHHPTRVRTCPVRLRSLNEFLDEHDGVALGCIKLHQVMCWNSSLYVKVGATFVDGHEFRESFVELFVALVDQSSAHCVSANAMQSNMQRLVVSGKGQVGCHGRKLWKGGYTVVLKSIMDTLSNVANVDRQVVCPECLAHAHPSIASTWSWDSVRAAANCGNSVVRCIRGHRVDSNLICGTAKRHEVVTSEDNGSSQRLAKVPDLLKSVVVVGLYNAREKKIKKVGSGFIVDKKLGLIVTAGHVLFNMEDGRDFGKMYCGVKLARAVIGIIPEKGQTAVFRYYAEVISHDIRNMDACVLRIVSRMENDVGGDGSGCGDQPELPLRGNSVTLLKEDLQSLKLTRHFELEECVRLLGFNQGGEGLLEEGKHVNLSADFVKGYICKKFKPQLSDDSSSSSDSSRSNNFAPREEIVVMCYTVSGHSGGPCVNDEGKVVGILSRADPAEQRRCYLVPSSELKLLVNKAKEDCAKNTYL